MERKCNHCSKKFSQKFTLKRHVISKHKEKTLICDCCEKSYINKKELEKHLKKTSSLVCKFCKLKFIRAREKLSHETTCEKKKILGEKVFIFCEYCKVNVEKRYFFNHERSLVHMNKLFQTCSTDIEISTHCFKNQCAVYKIECKKKEHEVDSKKFLEDYQQTIVTFLHHQKSERTSFKVKLTLMAAFHRQTSLDLDYEESVKHFSSQFCLITALENPDEEYQLLMNEVLTGCQEFEFQNSGWSLLKNICLLLDVVNYRLRVGSYIALPDKIRKKNCVVNFKNNDHYCFLYCVVYHFFHKKIEKKNETNPEAYKKFFKHFELKGLQFPLTTNDILKFEKLNSKLKISFNIYHYHNEFSVIRLSKTEMKNHINILMIHDVNDFHYCYIKNLSKLLRSHVTKHSDSVVFCNQCLSHFSKQAEYALHRKIGCNGTKIEVPSYPFVKFKKIYAKNKLKFMIYADFESKMVQINENKIFNPTNSYTKKLSEHKVIGASYKIVSFDDNPKFTQLRSRIGDDALSFFFKNLIKDLTEISKEYFSFIHPQTKLTDQHKNFFENQTKCHICEKILDKDSQHIVVDHDHLVSPYDKNKLYGKPYGNNGDGIVGNIRGLAHSACNLEYQEKKHFVVVMHNSMHYDAHFCLRYIASLKRGKLSCIARSSENYITFTWKLENNNEVLTINFIDSYKFLSNSLSKIIDSMDNFPIYEDYFKRKFGDKHLSREMIRKAPMFYEFITDVAKLNTQAFPPKSAFFSSLQNSNISDKDYEIGVKIYEKLNFKSLKQYVKFYLNSDVCYLADACEVFRNFCLEKFKLDPLGYYFSLASFSFDAMLLYSNLEIPIIKDKNIILFAQQSIRGGLCFGSQEYVKSNSRYDINYKKEEEESQILTLDVVSLYATAMKNYPLPFGEYKWLDKDELENLEKNILKISLFGNVGFLVEADVNFPEEIHDKLSIFPLLPESKIMHDKSTKLIASLLNKRNYKCHFGLLQNALKNGAVLVKIRSAIKFHQQKWLEPYMSYVINLRKQAKIKIYQDILKLCLNIIFGKLTENLQNHINFKLITSSDSEMVRNRWFANPRFKNFKIFSKNLLGVELKTQKVVYSRPNTCGTSILDLSKLYMSQIVYNVLEPQLKSDFKILYSDSDSFFIYCKGEKGYEMIRNNPHMFDTSDFESENIYNIIPQNKKLAGKLKVENSNSVIQSFIFLRPKAYAILLNDNGEESTIKKAKGVNKSIIHCFSFNDYLNVFQNRNHIMAKMFNIMSFNHKVFTVENNKKSLSIGCNKRYFFRDGTSLPYGHYKIKNVNLPF